MATIVNLKVHIVVILIAITVLGGCASPSPAPPPPCQVMRAPRSIQRPLNACNRALEACGVLVKAQEQSIVTLKAQVSGLEQSLKTETEGPIVPNWLYFVAGLASGALLSAHIK